jgi:hypothetical protein
MLVTSEFQSRTPSLRKTTKNLGIAGLRAEICTRDMPNAKQKSQSLDDYFWFNYNIFLLYIRIVGCDTETLCETVMDSFMEVSQDLSVKPRSQGRVENERKYKLR